MNTCWCLWRFKNEVTLKPLINARAIKVRQLWRKAFKGGFESIFFYFKIMAGTFVPHHFYFKSKTTRHKWLCFFFCLSQPVLLENLYLFEAVFDIKWCHKVFDMNSLEFTKPFHCSARGPCSKFALRDGIFLVITSILLVWFGGFKPVGILFAGY